MHIYHQSLEICRLRFLNTLNCDIALTTTPIPEKYISKTINFDKNIDYLIGKIGHLVQGKYINIIEGLKPTQISTKFSSSYFYFTISAFKGKAYHAYLFLLSSFSLKSSFLTIPMHYPESFLFFLVNAFFTIYNSYGY